MLWNPALLNKHVVSLKSKWLGGTMITKGTLKCFFQMLFRVGLVRNCKLLKHCFTEVEPGFTFIYDPKPPVNLHLEYFMSHVHIICNTRRNTEPQKRRLWCKPFWPCRDHLLLVLPRSLVMTEHCGIPLAWRAPGNWSSLWLRSDDLCTKRCQKLYTSN